MLGWSMARAASAARTARARSARPVGGRGEISLRATARWRAIQVARWTTVASPRPISASMRYPWRIEPIWWLIAAPVPSPCGD